MQRLRGCTVVDNLEIQVKGGDSIVHELERNLGDIVEIRGNLKIARSFPLLSLNFLKSLRVIWGGLTSGLPVAVENSSDSVYQEDE